MIFNEIGFFSEAMMTVSNVLILVFIASCNGGCEITNGL